MNPIYLSEIELQEFRGFSKLTVALPPMPGVLVVHGANGLGKSSLFDGLEWTFTNRVDHYPEAKTTEPRNYLRRWKAPAGNPTHVRLEFSDGGWIRRTLAGLDRDGITDVTAFLKAPSWKTEIRHLNRYLLLTHFLGQSTATRMTHRDARERWEFLKGPAQSDRAAELAKALHGHGSSLPAQTYNRLSEELTRQVSELERLLSDEQQQWQAAQLDGAIDDLAADQEARDLYASWDEVLSTLGGNVPLAASTGLDLRIADLPILADNAQALVRSREEVLEQGRRLLAEQLRVDGEISAHNATLLALQLEAEAASPRRIQARVHLDELTARLDALTEQLSVAQTSLDALSTLERGLGRLAELRAAVLSTSSLRNTISDQLTQATDDVAKAERRRALADRLTARLNDIQSKTERLAGRVDQLTATTAAFDEMRDAVSDHERWKLDHQDLPIRIQTAQSERDNATLELQRLQNEYISTKSMVDDLSAAVASVATHLGPDACECPVCATSFASSQELRDRVDNAVDRLAPVISVLERAVISATKALTNADAILSELLSFEVELNRRTSRRKRAETQFELLIGAVGQVSSVGPEELAHLLDQATEEIRTAEIRRRRIEHWQQHPVVGGTTGSIALWSQAVQTRNELVGALDACEQEIARLNRALVEAIQGVDAAAAAANATSDIDSTDLELLRKERSESERSIREVLSATRNEYQAAEATAQLTESSGAQLNVRIGDVTRTLASLATSAQEMSEEWQTLGLEGAISDSGLNRLASQLPQYRNALAALEKRFQRLRDGRVAWLRQESHKKTLGELRTLLDAAPITDRDALQRAGRTRQSALLRRTDIITRAKRIASEANAEVGRQVESFNIEFLAPLSDLMQRLNRAILTDPDIGVGLKVGKSKVDQKTIAPPGAPDYVSDLDPRFVHSEGQMAALAVSMLCAANLTFQWSRWSALIMDDPLQHNDIVHAAAFADLLCNLILTKGYQVFLSTHDLSEAEFLKRKFSAAGIPCTTINLLGRGSGGVESLVANNHAAIGLLDLGRREQSNGPA